MYVASVSFGKDSLAMLLLILEKKLPLDEVVFFDTGMEFEAIYSIEEKVVALLKEHNIKYTRLTPDKPFTYYMFEKPVKGRTKEDHNGYSWCGNTCRWGTSLKTKAMKPYKDCKMYVGIAADEPDRIIRAKAKGQLLPLVDYNMTEQDCLDYCKSKGFSYLEGEVDLYSLLDRCSCWCCANKNLKELRNIFERLPKYWSRLKELQSKTDIPFYQKRKTIEDLEKKFLTIPKK